MADSKRRYWLLTRLIGLAIAVLILVLAYYLRPGIRVTVVNLETTPLRSVVVQVIGASYSLGDIAPGESAATLLHPRGDGVLHIQFEDADGETCHVVTRGYFDSGFRGTLRVWIKNKVIYKEEENTW